MAGYLVISRRVNERIKIGDDVEILISDIIDNKVDVAVKAPKEIKITRLKSHAEEAKERGDFSDGSRRKHQT